MACKIRDQYKLYAEKCRKRMVIIYREDSDQTADM